MAPSPITIIWEGLKLGMVVWPFETKPGEYFALPLYIVIPALVILIGGPALIIHFAWRKSAKDVEQH